MIEILLEEQKQLALAILKSIADFCDKRGLRYYLAYGTMLGAVRHNGFIPWDDDIDIMMPRDDYNQFWPITMDTMKFIESARLKG